jgi:hypothetical protein
MKATLLSTNGNKSEIELTSFSHAQSLIKGLVEIILLEGVYLLLNEEGLIANLPTNPFLPQFKGDILIVNPKSFNKLPYNNV